MGLTAGQILQRYRGFDGVLWPEGELPLPERPLLGMAPASTLEQVLRYSIELRQPAIDVLYCSTANPDPERWRESALVSASCAGFDFGVLASTENHYSVVLNEILLGQDERLRRLSGQLNGSLLFQTVEAAEAARRLRATVVRDNGDLEDLSFDTQLIMAVWVLKAVSPQ